ncbi:MAG: LamG domain-containing protein, partial [Thermoguttaceae bacterium]|nr:LamG domain-containing protein [Thermoguttaceae bacterium]
MRRRSFLWLGCAALIACAGLWAEEGKDPALRWSFDTLDGNWTRSENANLAEGVHGKALDCRDTILQLPTDTVPNGWPQISYAAWVFPRQFTSFNEIFRKEDDSNRLLFSFQGGGTILSIGANIGGTYTECDGLLPEEGILNQWHYVVGTVRTADDGRTTTMRVYFDGLLLNEVRVPGQLIYGGDAPCFIASSKGDGEFFDGLIDDLAIYDRPLSEEEILAVKAPDYPSLVKTLLERASEFEPLTEDQRLHLPKREQEKWARFAELKKSIVEKIQTGDADPAQWQEMMATLRAWAPERPYVSEAVAPYQKPYTPKVVDRTPEEAEQLLRSDWLVQCGGNPSKWTILNELRRASELADRIEDAGADLAEERREIETLSEEAKKVADSDEELYYKVRRVKRSILFKNPAIDFD